MELAFNKSGTGEPMLILHGLYGSSDNWFTIGKKLSAHYEVYLIDQRNHGRSPHNADNSYNAMREDLHEFFRAHDIKKAVILGHSMGGKTAMSFSMKYQEMVSRLIIVDISPVDYNTSGNREITLHRTIISAMQQLDPQLVNSREEADMILSGAIPWKHIRQFLLKNLKRSHTGKFMWALNIEAISANIETIASGIIPEGSEMTMDIPALFIKGEKSDYIGEEDEYAIKKLFPMARIATIPGAGHWVHAEQPSLFLKEICDFSGY